MPDNTDTSSLLSTLGQLANTGAQVYGTVSGKPAAKPAAAPAAATSSWTSYLPWIAGGAVVLVLAIFLIKK